MVGVVACEGRGSRFRCLLVPLSSVLNSHVLPMLMCVFSTNSCFQKDACLVDWFWTVHSESAGMFVLVWLRDEPVTCRCCLPPLSHWQLWSWKGLKLFVENDWMTSNSPLNRFPKTFKVLPRKRTLKVIDGNTTFLVSLYTALYTAPTQQCSWLQEITNVDRSD